MNTLPATTKPAAPSKATRKQLESVDDCAAVIRQLESVEPMTPDEAMQAVRFLMTAGFGGRQSDDLDLYLRHLCDEMIAYPAGVAREAVKRLARERKTYPSRAHLHEACEAIERERRSLLKEAHATMERLTRAAREQADREARKSGPLEKKRFVEMTPEEKRQAERNIEAFKRKVGYTR